MRECPWEKIDDFRSYNEFKKIISWVDEQIQKGVAEEVSVQDQYSGGSFKEKWFLHKESGTIWRLVWPEVPFTGVFKLVDETSKKPLT